MKGINRLLPTLALALCASSAPLLAQQELPSSPALERAIVVEEVEHDRRQALTMFQKLAGNEALPAELRRHAALRLGKAQALLGDLDAARVALEQAAVGDDAIARLAREALADPGDDEERARLLREEARRWLKQLPTRKRHRDIWKDTEMSRLLWIGRHAVPEIVREFESQRKHIEGELPWDAPLTAMKWHGASMVRGDDVALGTLMSLSALLWRIGGPEAAAYLDSLREAESSWLRLLVVAGLQGDNAREDEMVAVAQRYLLDPDPKGEVSVLALGDWQGVQHSTWKRYDVDAILAMVDSPVKRVRAGALELLRSGWPSLRHEGDETITMQKLTPSLERALDDVRPEVIEQANATFQRLALLSPASRALLVRRLPQASPDFRLGPASDATAQPGEAAIEGLLPMLRELGPVSTTTKRQRDVAVDTFVQFYGDVLDRGDLEMMLEYLRLGYDQRTWYTARWIQNHCDERDTQRVLTAMVEHQELEQLLGWMTHRGLGQESWPLLRSVQEKLQQREPDYDWSEWNDVQSMSLTAIGGCAAPEAVAFLAEQLEGTLAPMRYEAIARGLLYAARSRPDADVIAALHKALLTEVSEGSGRRNSPHDLRLMIFARLVELGDAQAFTLLPEALERGMGHHSLPSEFSDQPEFEQQSSYALGWLFEYVHEADGLRYFHGYDDETLAAVWDGLLSQPRDEEWNRSWQELRKALNPYGGFMVQWGGQQQLPREYREPNPALVEVFAKHWEQAVNEGASSSAEWDGLRFLLDIERRGLMTDGASVEALARLHRAALASDSAHTRRIALDMFPAELDAAATAAMHAALTDPDLFVAKVAVRRTFENGQPVERELFLRVARSPQPFIRGDAIRRLAPLVDSPVAEDVKLMLADPDASVRQAACRFLGTQVEASVIPELLAALTDIDENVRKSAAEALRAIRFYHDEKAHWDRVFAGTELSASGAAEALLKQAAETSPRQVRLLAIQSLGSLGAPETLPFLIEWTTDDDTVLAEAARAAITRIHASGD